MITNLFNAANWCAKHRLKILSTFLLFIATFYAKGQTQRPNFVFTATSTETFGWKAMVAGWGNNKIVTDTGYAFEADTSKIMTVTRASDSIENMKASIATKMATAAFTGAAIISALGFTPYNSTNPNNYITSAGLSGYVQSTRNISTSSPLSGGGDLSADRTISIANAKADNSTKGAASFDAPYFDDNGSGIISFAVATGSATINAGAVTLNQPRGKITYNSPNIVAAGTATFTLTNSFVSSTSTINVGINGNGNNLVSVNCYIKSQTSGSCVIAVQNLSLLNLFNSNMIIDFLVVN